MVIAPVAILLVQHWMIAPALALVLGTCLVVRGVRLLASQRRKSGPIASIDRITTGEAEIRGVATGPYSITAPITGKKCYLYHATVWQQKLRSAPPTCCCSGYLPHPRPHRSHSRAIDILVV